MRANTPDDFWRFVEKIPGVDCWLWTGTPHADGYGVFHLRRKHIGAHRFSWVLANGEIPAGVSVLHKCDNPPCVRPDHLFLGTQQDNVMDRDCKGRGNQPRGERNGNATTSAEDVRAIRSDTRIYRIIAAVFGISLSNVKHIKSRRTWKHI